MPFVVAVSRLSQSAAQPIRCQYEWADFDCGGGVCGTSYQTHCHSVRQAVGERYCSEENGRSEAVS